MATFNTDATTTQASPVSEASIAPGLPQPDETIAQGKENIGLSQQEMNDPNAIKVILQNPDIPIVVFFGPPTCGKTMTLIRLCRFLVSNGYRVEPVRSFRPSYDSNYQHVCESFNTMINSDMAQEGTTLINFMLVEVSRNGHPLCQLLEAPGEHYFKPKEPNNPFPAYINAISSSHNRKLWGFFIEPDHTNSQIDHEDRLNYVDRIRRFNSYMHPRDRVSIIFNKIDETDCIISQGGAVHTGEAIRKAKYSYPGLFDLFANQNPITRLWKSSRADFIPYMNGYFTKLANGGISFQLGHDNYPLRLWKSIMKSIKG